MNGCMGFDKIWKSTFCFRLYDANVHLKVALPKINLMNRPFRPTKPLKRGVKCVTRTAKKTPVFTWTPLYPKF
jgi:hypothetical protein